MSHGRVSQTVLSHALVSGRVDMKLAKIKPFPTPTQTCTYKNFVHNFKASKPDQNMHEMTNLKDQIHTTNMPYKAPQKQTYNFIC